jgi:hypothetical protein
MYYALVFYPTIEADRIQAIRRKYDHTMNVIKPHVTMLSPVPEALGELRLLGHIEDAPLALGCYHKVIRGGNYNSGTWRCRSAFHRRSGSALGHPMEGFRVVCVVDIVTDRGPFVRQAIGQKKGED